MPQRKGDEKILQINFQVTPEEMVAWKNKAAASGMSLRTYMHHLLQLAPIFELTATVKKS